MKTLLVQETYADTMLSDKSRCLEMARRYQSLPMLRMKTLLVQETYADTMLSDQPRRLEMARRYQSLPMLRSVLPKVLSKTLDGSFQFYELSSCVDKYVGPED